MRHVQHEVMGWGGVGWGGVGWGGVGWGGVGGGVGLGVGVGVGWGWGWGLGVGVGVMPLPIMVMSKDQTSLIIRPLPNKVMILCLSKGLINKNLTNVLPKHSSTNQHNHGLHT